MLTSLQESTLEEPTYDPIELWEEDHFLIDLDMNTLKEVLDNCYRWRNPEDGTAFHEGDLLLYSFKRMGKGTRQQYCKDKINELKLASSLFRPAGLSLASWESRDLSDIEGVDVEYSFDGHVVWFCYRQQIYCITDSVEQLNAGYQFRGSKFLRRMNL